MTNDQIFILKHGCHRGTLISRDIAQPENHPTYEAARASYLKHRDFYRSIGYQIWFAEIVQPDGNTVKLESNGYR